MRERLTYLIFLAFLAFSSAASSIDLTIHVRNADHADDFVYLFDENSSDTAPIWSGKRINDNETAGAHIAVGKDGLGHVFWVATQVHDKDRCGSGNATGLAAGATVSIVTSLTTCPKITLDALKKAARAAKPAFCDSAGVCTGQGSCQLNGNGPGHYNCEQYCVDGQADAGGCQVPGFCPKCCNGQFPPKCSDQKERTPDPVCPGGEGSCGQVNQSTGQSCPKTQVPCTDATGITTCVDAPKCSAGK